MTRYIAAAAAAAAILAATGPTFADPAPPLGPLLAAQDWLNGRVSPAGVKGKVVLVDFYTFDCINCKHVEPNLRALYSSNSRKDLVIISVHSPETPNERDRDHLIASTKDQGVAWPIVVDNDFKTWNAYGVSAWPTQLIFDRRGVLNQTVIGEGQDQLVNNTIAQLIAQH
jgi:thiol-disulfide isomerase/thioredoxin